MDAAYPILEYDPARKAIINPEDVNRRLDIPRHCVLCFFQDVIASLSQVGLANKVGRQKSEIGAHPIFRVEHDGRPFALFHPGVGAPLAAALLEELIARGCDRFIAIGSAGVLDSSIAMGHLLVVSHALRDEGTSYHYLPPSRWIEADPATVRAIETTLKAAEAPFLTTRTWTTDAIFRETPDKIARRRAEGCLAVEMEAAAFLAVARFRDVRFGQILYGGDDVSGNQWQARGWTKNAAVREKMLWLAAEACFALEEQPAK